MPTHKHIEPGISNPGAIGDRSQVPAAQHVANEFHFVHFGFIPQSVAERNSQNEIADRRQGVATDYRRVLRINLAALLDARGRTPATLRAVYIAGPKNGKIVSERTIHYMLAEPGHGKRPGPSLDTLAAVARALDAPVHRLLLPECATA